MLLLTSALTCKNMLAPHKLKAAQHFMGSFISAQALVGSSIIMRISFIVSEAPQSLMIPVSTEKNMTYPHMQHTEKTLSRTDSTNP